MKGNIKKLAVFVMIAAMAVFAAMATASAFDDEWSHTIRGKWAFTGFHACLTAFPPGFDADLSPLNGSAPINSQSWLGEYTFKHSGGALDAVAHDVGASQPGSGGGSVSVHWEFNYTVKNDGKITFTLVPGSYIATWLTGTQAGQPAYFDFPGSWDGVISPDGNHMFLTWGAPLILYLLDSQGGNRIGVQIICNGSFVLFRL